MHQTGISDLDYIIVLINHCRDIQSKSPLAVKRAESEGQREVAAF